MRLSDLQLWQAVKEMESGLIEANLGSHVYKKRVPLQGRGKRGSVRVVIVYKAAEKIFFVLGFAKNEKANLSAEELQSVRALASELLSILRHNLTGQSKQVN